MWNFSLKIKSIFLVLLVSFCIVQDISSKPVTLWNPFSWIDLSDWRVQFAGITGGVFGACIGLGWWKKHIIKKQWKKWSESAKDDDDRKIILNYDSEDTKGFINLLDMNVKPAIGGAAVAMSQFLIFKKADNVSYEKGYQDAIKDLQKKSKKQLQPSLHKKDLELVKAQEKIARLKKENRKLKHEQQKKYAKLRQAIYLSLRESSAKRIREAISNAEEYYKEESKREISLASWKFKEELFAIHSKIIKPFKALKARHQKIVNKKLFSKESFDWLGEVIPTLDSYIKKLPVDFSDYHEFKKMQEKNEETRDELGMSFFDLGYKPREGKEI